MIFAHDDMAPSRRRIYISVENIEFHPCEQLSCGFHDMRSVLHIFIVCDAHSVENPNLAQSTCW
jgi:hypothetical protein